MMIRITALTRPRAAVWRAKTPQYHMLPLMDGAKALWPPPVDYLNIWLGQAFAATPHALGRDATSTEKESYISAGLRYKYHRRRKF